MLSVGGLWRLAFKFREMWLVGAATVVSLAGVLWQGAPIGVSISAVLAGIVGWGISEYVFHRFVLHLPKPPGRLLERAHARLHWKHHQDPDDPKFLFIPLWGSIGLFGMSVGFGYWAAAWPGAAGASLGLALALLHYESTHLAAHVAYAPRTRWGKFMKRFHRLHHYKNERYWFGVTHPGADMLVGTWPDQGAVEKSRTARTLGIDPEPLRG